MMIMHLIVATWSVQAYAQRRPGMGADVMLEGVF